jgi:hypothetical protein
MGVIIPRAAPASGGLTLGFHMVRLQRTTATTKRANVYN